MGIDFFGHGLCKDFPVSHRNEHLIQLLQAAGYTVEHFPNRHYRWRVVFQTSEGIGESLRSAIKRCYWAYGALSGEGATPILIAARQTAVKAMTELENLELRK